MLPKKNRADKKAIEKIFKEGRFVNSPNLTLKFVYLPLHDSPQVSALVPKTAVKKASARNLLRRRAYEVLKKYIQQLPAQFTGALVFGKRSAAVFGGRKTKIYNPIQNLEHELTIILNKLH